MEASPSLTVGILRQLDLHSRVDIELDAVHKAQVDWGGVALGAADHEGQGLDLVRQQLGIDVDDLQGIGEAIEVRGQGPRLAGSQVRTSSSSSMSPRPLVSSPMCLTAPFLELRWLK